MAEAKFTEEHDSTAEDEEIRKLPVNVFLQRFSSHWWYFRRSCFENCLKSFFFFFVVTVGSCGSSCCRKHYKRKCSAPDWKQSTAQWNCIVSCFSKKVCLGCHCGSVDVIEDSHRLPLLDLLNCVAFSWFPGRANSGFVLLRRGRTECSKSSLCAGSCLNVRSVVLRHC